MTSTQLIYKLNKELIKRQRIDEATILLLLIYIQSLPRKAFHGKFTKAEQREASKYAKIIGRENLKQLNLPHSASTILDWLARNYRKGKSNVKRRLSQVTFDTLKKIAEENPGEGYSTYFGIMQNLHLPISRSSIVRYLKMLGIPPLKRRAINFMEKITHSIKWHCCDFAKITIETLGGEVTISILFVLNIQTRKVCIVGCTENPNAEWTKNMMRNLTMEDWGFMKRGDRLIHNNDGCFMSHRVQKLLKDSGIESVNIPPYSPNCNSFAERFVRTLREKCLRKSFFYTEGQLRRSLKSFEEFYNGFRNHQGIGNVLIDDVERERIKKNRTGKIKRTYFGSGNYYYHRAA